MSTALVLGGGGITGIAWELGILAGLAEAGIDLTDADRVIGTSAGSVVGVQITGGTAIAELYDGQLSPPDAELGGRLSRLALLKMVPPFVLPGDGRTKLARVGKLAIRRTRPAAPIARASSARGSRPTSGPTATCRSPPWRRRRASSPSSRRDSGVDVVSAVAASCAVPTVWPPVAINGRHYIDGGMRSTANVDLAAGADRVVVLAPLPQALSKRTSIRAQLEKVAPRAVERHHPRPRGAGRLRQEPARPGQAGRCRAGRDASVGRPRRRGPPRLGS